MMSNRSHRTGPGQCQFWFSTAGKKFKTTWRKIIAVICATFAAGKRKPEKDSGFFFSGFLFATVKLVYITAMIFLHSAVHIHDFHISTTSNSKLSALPGIHISSNIWRGNLSFDKKKKKSLFQRLVSFKQVDYTCSQLKICNESFVQFFQLYFYCNVKCNHYRCNMEQ